MKPVYVVADNIYSPMGLETAANFKGVMEGTSGIRRIINQALAHDPFYASSFMQFPYFEGEKKYTRFETLCIASITDALQQTEIALTDNETVFILSSTKGNIELIEMQQADKNLKDRVSLFNTAKIIARHFTSFHDPLVVSNACISGVAAVIFARRLLESGKYKHAVITGADIISKFIVSGFQCLYAMSDKPCRPFDKNRNGINLGECAATMVLSTNCPSNKTSNILVNDGAITNDANHISGPSRTGMELSIAVNTAIAYSGIKVEDISFISAHGTATIFNDDMEAKAFCLSGLSDIPLHSLKGNYGHTLGAAGVLESILTYQSLLKGVILPSKNFEELGVPEKITVNTSPKTSTKQHALKTASGFGGCNAAIIYSIA